jgi:hypothetical protein
MSGVLIVFLGVVLPFVIMFTGVVTMIKSRNNDTVKGMVIGVVMAIVGGLWLLLFSIFLVHELMTYAPYFTNDLVIF